MDKIHINFGPLDVGEKDVEKYFKEFGEIVLVEIPENKHYGFVTFKKNESVDKILEKKIHKLDGFVVKVQRYNKQCSKGIHECKHCGKIILPIRRFRGGTWRRRRRGRGRGRGRSNVKWIKVKRDDRTEYSDDDEEFEDQ